MRDQSEHLGEQEPIVMRDPLIFCAVGYHIGRVLRPG
jgi:hypothetical protein